MTDTIPKLSDEFDETLKRLELGDDLKVHAGVLQAEHKAFADRANNEVAKLNKELEEANAKVDRLVNANSILLAKPAVKDVVKPFTSSEIPDRSYIDILGDLAL